MRRALTILECMIALSIFFALLTSLLQAAVSMQRYGDQKAVESNASTDIDRAIAQMTDDLGNAAWFSPLVLSDPANASSLLQFDTQPILPAIYPSGTSTGTPSLSTPAAPRTPYFMELWFVRLRTERILATSPLLVATENINFNNTSLTAIAMSNFWQKDSLPNVFSLIANDDATVAPFIGPVWETSLSGLTFKQNADPGYLRQYQYVVINYNATTGTGDLVRRWRDPDSVGSHNASSKAWTQDPTILLEGVTQVSFALSGQLFGSDPPAATLAATAVKATTLRLLPDLIQPPDTTRPNRPQSMAVLLEPNQIQIDITVKRAARNNNENEGRVLRYLTHTVAMRSITNPSSNEYTE